ncbi:MAG: malto-oligosyltrehalose synthase, partial [Xanthobacteraceae bacterium]
GRLISRNDVGFDVRRFAASPAQFHDAMARHVAQYPHSLLTTATHDHKRGEDVRSRLAVLSEFADEWVETMARWVDAALRGCAAKAGPASPMPGDLAILFQTIVGAWPMSLGLGDQAGLSVFANRIAAWQQKAVREAKLRSDWSAPNDAYEGALANFISRLFSVPNDLLTELHSFAARIMAPGAVNGLAQMLVKLTAPGVPDIYQGTEYWDLSLVDPDNRAPVDFAMRERSLNAASLDEVVAAWPDGRIKQRLMANVFAVRKKIPSIFSSGAYIPLTAAGPQAERVVAFARTAESGTTITVVCKSVASGVKDTTITIPASFWRGTCLIFPERLRMPIADALAPPRSLVLAEKVDLGTILDRLPVAFLVHDATAR